MQQIGYLALFNFERWQVQNQLMHGRVAQLLHIFANNPALLEILHRFRTKVVKVSDTKYKTPNTAPSSVAPGLISQHSRSFESRVRGFQG